MGPSSPRTRPASRPTTARIDSGSSATTPASRLAARSPTSDGRSPTGRRDPRRRNRDQRFLAARPRRRPADLHHLPGRRRPGRPRRAPERLPYRADRPRDGLPPRGVPGPERTEDRARRRRLRLRPGRREGARRVLRAEPGGGRDLLTVPAGAADLAPEVSAHDAPMRPLSSCGASRRRSRACSPLLAARAGTSRCTHRPRARIRSSVNSSPSRGWTASPSQPVGPTAEVGPGPFLAFQDKYERASASSSWG